MFEPLQNGVHGMPAETRAEQGLRLAAALGEHGLPTRDQGSVIDAEQVLEQLRVDAAEAGLQARVVERVAVRPVKQGRLAALAPVAHELHALRVAQAATAAQLLVGVAEIVRRPYRHAEEERAQGPQGRALAGFVRTVITCRPSHPR